MNRFSVRRWALAGFLGVLVVLMLPTLYDAWTVNQAGIMINRVVAARASGGSAKIGQAAAEESAEETKLLSSAKALLQDAAARDPHSPAREIPIWRTYGAAAALSPSDQAFALLSAASRNDLLDRIGELWLGEVASATNHPSEAAAAYQRVDASNLLISKADAYMESGDKDRAIGQYRYARISLEAAMRREAAQRLLSGKDRATSVTAALMTSAAERVTALYRIGRGLLAAGEPADAVAVLEEASVKAETASPGAVVQQSLDLNLALALARTLPDPETVAYLAGLARIRRLVYGAVEAGPTAATDVLAGRTLLLIGDDERATALLREAIHLDPLIPEAYLALGSWYESKGFEFPALLLYAEGARALPANTPIAVAYAIASYRALAPAEARPILEQTAKMPTDDPYFFAVLGDCYLDLGLAAEARAAYEEGLRRAPNAKPLTERLETLDKWIAAHGQ